MISNKNNPNHSNRIKLQQKDRFGTKMILTNWANPNWLFLHMSIFFENCAECPLSQIIVFCQDPGISSVECRKMAVHQ